MYHDFVGLPVEIIYSIKECMSHSEVVNLSSTCVHLRELLVPWLFQALRITTDTEHAETGLAVAQKYGTYVKEIKFSAKFIAEKQKISAPSESKENQKSEEPVAEIILKLLADAEELLPALDQITLTITPKSERKWSKIFWNVENENDLEARYKVDRTLMNIVYDTIRMNDKIKSLIMNELQPIRSDTWKSEEFQQFLGGLETFRLSLWGETNGAGGYANTSLYYGEFCQDLGEYFFRHLQSVISVQIESSKWAPLGQNDNHMVPYSLKPNYMPNCQNLELVWCLIDPKLRDFIISHAKILKTLNLRDCDAVFDHSNRITWEDFFTSISLAEPVLSTLIIKNSKIPLTKKEKWDMPDDGDVSENVKQVRAILQDPLSKRRLFSYAYIDDEYGMHFKYEAHNVSRFLDGGDQAAYDKLMRVVDSNHSRNC